MSQDKEKFQQMLLERFPTARPGFISVLLDALATHARKNNDYNGAKPVFTDPPTLDERFYDLKRKYGRLHNLIRNKTQSQVDEKIEETAEDLGVYSLMMVEDLRQGKIKQVHIGEEMNEQK